MMQPWKWLIEPDVFPIAETDKLVACLTKLGIDHRIVNLLLYSYIPKEDTQFKIFAYGSTRHMGCYPLNIDYWYSPIRYSFTKTMPLLNRESLNFDYHLLSARTIVNRLKYQTQLPYCGPHEFIKADTGMKIMTTYPDMSQFTHEVIEELEPLGDTLVVVASMKAIYEEWRFWCTSNDILAGVKYHSINHEWKIPTPYEISQYVQRMLPTMSLNLDPIFIVDIALCPNIDTTLATGSALVPKVVEVNAFSTSGWYDLLEGDILKVLAKWKEIVSAKEDR